MKREIVSVLIVLGAASVGCSTAGTDGTGGNGGAGGGGTVVTSASTTTTQPTATTGTAAGPATTGPGATTTGVGATTTVSTGSGNDPYAAARATCIAKINSLRATKGLSPYGEWSAADTCVDQQVTSDEMAMSAHQAWINGTYPSCNGNGQNECLGQGVQGISGCLDQMWAEKNQPNCSGCDACANAYDPNCPNCDFYGNNGPECGHYVNMSAKYFTQAVCGFSSLGGWDAINFK